MILSDQIILSNTMWGVTAGAGRTTQMAMADMPQSVSGSVAYQSSSDDFARETRATPYADRRVCERASQQVEKRFACCVQWHGPWAAVRL